MFLEPSVPGRILLVDYLLMPSFFPRTLARRNRKGRIYDARRHFSRRLTVVKGCDKRASNDSTVAKVELRIFNDRLKWTAEIFEKAPLDPIGRILIPSQTLVSVLQSLFFPFLFFCFFQQMLIKRGGVLRRLLGFSQTRRPHVH